MPEPGKIPQENALRHERPLGRTRGAAGVDEQRRIARRRGDRCEMRRSLLQKLLPRLNPGFPRSGDADHVLEERQPVANRGETGERCGIDERGDGFAVLQAILEGIRPEQHRKGHRHHAHLVAGDMRDRRFRALRQNDPDPIAAHNAEAGERIRQAVRLLLQIPEGDCERRPGLVLPIQGQAGALG